MESTVARAGRIVVPRKIREELGLVGGTRLEIRIRESHLEIEPAATSSVTRPHGVAAP